MMLMGTVISTCAVLVYTVLSTMSRAESRL